jgi:hypothetical protein
MPLGQFLIAHAGEAAYLHRQLAPFSQPTEDEQENAKRPWKVLGPDGDYVIDPRHAVAQAVSA